MARRAAPGRPPGRLKKAYHHGDLRAALVREAAAQVVRAGHPSVSVREVARAAGVSHAAAYHHFPTRAALLAAIAAAGFDEMTAALETAWRGYGPPLERFGQLGHAYVRHAIAHAPMYRLMFSAETAARDQHPELRDAAARTFAVLAEAVRECQAAGLVRDGAPIDHALAAWSTIHGLASLWLEGQLWTPGLRGRSARDLTTVVLDGSYRGLAAPRSSSRRP
jgi:AcrR family transcriptional regulator